jgi:hypothetical protein
MLFLSSWETKWIDHGLVVSMVLRSQCSIQQEGAIITKHNRWIDLIATVRHVATVLPWCGKGLSTLVKADQFRTSLRTGIVLCSSNVRNKRVLGNLTDISILAKMLSVTGQKGTILRSIVIDLARPVLLCVSKNESHPHGPTRGRADE